MFGVREIIVIIIIAIMIRGMVSFTRNSGLNLILSIMVRELEGLEDPFS